MDLTSTIKERFSKPFPIIPNVRTGERLTVTWAAALRAYALYSALFGTEQSLERMYQRGGFHEDEMDTFYPEWRNHIIK